MSIVRVSYLHVRIAPMRIDPYSCLTRPHRADPTLQFLPLTWGEGRVAVEATLDFACPETDQFATESVHNRSSASHLVNVAVKAAAVFLAGVALTLSGATTAMAAPGVVDVQSGSSVDTDGTQGSWAPATSGTQRQLSTQTGSGHQITSDACYVKNNPKYCPPPSSFQPEFIQATSGTSDDPDSALDADGYQADQVRSSPAYTPQHH